METERPDPFRYHDATQFLSDFLNYKRTSDAEFSVRRLAKNAGVSIGYISNILHGKRRLTPKGLKKLVGHLALNRAEAAYIARLSEATLSTSLEERKKALSRLQRFHQYSELNPKDSELFRYFSKWYHLAIREMATLPGFKLDAKWIQGRLKTTVKLEELESALEFLVGAGFLKRSDRGRVERPTKRLEAHSAVLSVAMTQFHQQTLALAANALTDTPSAERHYLAHTFAVSRSDFDKARDILNEALEKIAKLGGTGPKLESVYQVSMTLYPWTRAPADPGADGGAND
ncbi:MAG TPA: TIGR02147 family protein [Bdellovibrionales bacterium]|nr:TIGR02147 family protein [Bdellovibrionales bacterium]